jgi:antitoxin component YwqK of YwqJK toxin-antitoxin module
MEKQAMNLINLYNEKGEQHGYWESYHDNGQLYFKGSYLNGKQHGYWEYYWDNGQLDYKGSYSNGERHGYWESYWDNGQLYFKGSYLNGNEITELTLEDIAEKFKIPVGQLKIKK